MWDLTRPGIEPVSSALQDRFLTTGPPGKSPDGLFFFHDSDTDFDAKRVCAKAPGQELTRAPSAVHLSLPP